MNLVILGLSITSSWGNGHATTYRALVRELDAQGHQVLFLERDRPWYAAARDLPHPPWGKTILYDGLPELQERFAPAVAAADLVIMGSYVPEGVAVGEWLLKTAQGVRAFYDIDTPVTLAKLRRQDYEYIAPHLIGQFDLYLSFTGGPVLDELERIYGARRARPLYCSFDPSVYYPEQHDLSIDLGYLGTYSDDRQPGLERLLIQPARTWPAGSFAVAGPQYPASINWPENLLRIEHLPPAEHRSFYCRQRFTLNITRAEMVRTGYAPSVRLFEAAACGVPVISDYWAGLETFFCPGKELLVANSTEESLSYLLEMPEAERQRLGERARDRVLREHTAAHRVQELETYLAEAR
ncbi:MAG: glycosyltransferase [Deltaproteobacteria bacterium]|nr:glycosyltransferase [Deltaproteobacteria bacterium]